MFSQQVLATMCEAAFVECCIGVEIPIGSVWGLSVFLQRGVIITYKLLAEDIIQPLFRCYLQVN